jgi:hypothetical protein
MVLELRVFRLRHLRLLGNYFTNFVLLFFPCQPQLPDTFLEGLIQVADLILERSVLLTRSFQ